MLVLPRGHHEASLPSTNFALSPPGPPETSLPTMSTHWVLRRLYSLDPSSPDFLRRLHSLIWYDEKEQYLTSLEGSELDRLADFLDKVRAVSSAFHHFTNYTPQAIDAIPTTDDVARQCVSKLQFICGHHTILPPSCIASGRIARVGDGPIARGAIVDVWEGTHDGEKVIIKCLRDSLTKNKTLKKVRILCRRYLSRLLKNACGPCSHSSKPSSYGED